MKYITLISIFYPFILQAQPFPFDIDGPDAPDMTISWGVGGFTFNLDNPPGSNNELFMYQEGFKQQPLPPDNTLRSQGYMILRLVSHPSTWPGEPGWLFRLNDSTYAIPAVIADLADTVTTGWDLLADCTPIHWQFPNNGISSTYTVAIDPVTQLPFEADLEYCFVAVAFATNPYHWDIDCDTLDQVIMSKSAALGAMQWHCVTGSQLVGVEESGIEQCELLYHPANDQLLLINPTNTTLSVRCADASGKLIYERSRVHSTVDVSDWPAGLYHITLSDGLDKVTRPIVIAR